MILDDDDGARIGLWTVLGVVALLLFFLVGSLAWRSVKSHAKPAAPAVAAVAAPAADADAVQDVPLAGEVIGKVYFESGKADLPADAEPVLGSAVAALAAGTTKKLMLSGFHDASGDPAKNAELAKNRAKAVRAALQAKGVAVERVGLRKPEQTGADGPADEARRVEIRLVD